METELMAEHKNSAVIPTPHKKPSVLKRLGQKFRYGLILFTIRNVLAKLGIIIVPYYWVLEGQAPIPCPEIRDQGNNYRAEYLKPSDIHILKNVSGINLEVLKKGLSEGRMEAIGLISNDTIAALMFIEFGTVENNKRYFKLDSNEAYLTNMYTFHDFRGLNLAPYLRYQSYQLLRERGYTKFYSITDYWNNASKRFKAKLEAQNVNLYLSLVWFKKWYWNFTLK